MHQFCKRRDDIISWDIFFFLKQTPEMCGLMGILHRYSPLLPPHGSRHELQLKIIEPLIVLKANLKCRAERVQKQLKIYCHYIFGSVCLASCRSLVTWSEKWQHAYQKKWKITHSFTSDSTDRSICVDENYKAHVKGLRTAEVVLTLILSLLCFSKSWQRERTTSGPWNQRGWID